ncbi:kinase-like domain-containing protein [Parasitella parasitica]|nr:kinase-like domain-containing protein [Parasitella parasitica]
MTTATMDSQAPTHDSRNGHPQQQHQHHYSHQQQQQSHRHHVQHIGNYVIHRKTLGSGSMGTVKLAECLSDRDHQQYAVKIMPKINLNAITASEAAKSKDPKDTPREREQRTIREMAIMHLLRHPNICQLKEWVVQGDHYYMFLEYIEGGQLLDYIISHGKLREKLARKFARQIVSALDYCHRNSIVHRDLKIENILITNHEEIKIIDFGLSNIYSPSRLLNTFCGSLYFAAPELLQARNYTGPEVDVWSFGVVLYVLVCGRVPFDDTSLPALHQKIKAGHAEYPDHLSKDCVDLLSKILVVDPTKRGTLSFVIHHPWMNKGYDEPIVNYLPHRQPLTSVDPAVIQGMRGFGLGTPEEIETKLLHIICSPEYQYAAAQVDQNHQQQRQQQDQQQQQDHQQNESASYKWRRTLSIRRTAPSAHHMKKDDPQHLPAMYDPLISIYCLVKERRQLDEKCRLLESEGYQSPVQIGRSASTSLTKSVRHVDSNSNLMRRKTERVPPSHARNMFKDDKIEDWAAPATTLDSSSMAPKRANSVKSTANILQRSKSAAKRLGAMLPNHRQQQQQPQDENTVARSHSSIAAHISAPEPTYSLKEKTINILRSNSLTERRYRQQQYQYQKRTSPSSSSTSSATEEDLRVISSSAPTSNYSGSSGGRFIEEGIQKQREIQQQQQQQQQTPKMSAHPKSLFNFSRRHLFKINTANMIKYVQQVLLKLGIRYIPSPHEPFTLKCELSDWARYQEFELDDEGLDRTDETVHFTIMVYQARWAGGRLGIKVIEAEEDDKFRRIYHTILNELGLLIKTQ